MSAVLFKKKLADGRTSLRLRINHKGQRWNESLNLYLSPGDENNQTTWINAKELQLKKEKELHTAGVVKPAASRKSVTDFMTEIAESEGMHSNYAQTLRWFLLYEEGNNGIDVLFRDLTPEMVEDFRDFMFENLKQGTTHTYFGLFKTMIGMARKQKIILTDPAEEVPNVQPSPETTEYLTVAELNKLSKTPYLSNPEVRRAFLFNCLTGPRPVDLMGFTSQNIHLTEDGGWELVYVPRKTRKVNPVPVRLKLDAKAIKLLGTIPEDPNKLLFDLPNLDTMGYHLEKWRQDAGIKKEFSWKISRHTFATHLVMNGEDIYVVARLLGHRGLQSVMRYVKLADEMKSRAAERVPAFDLPDDEHPGEVTKVSTASNLAQVVHA